MKRFLRALRIATILWFIFRVINPDYLGISFRIVFITLLALTTHNIIKIIKWCCDMPQLATRRQEDACIMLYGLGGIGIFEFLYRPLLNHGWLYALTVVSASSAIIAAICWLRAYAQHINVRCLSQCLVLFVPASIILYVLMCLLLRLSAALC